MFLRVHRIVQKTKVEGPGTRFCIWVQGCTRNCKGCFMPLAQPQSGGEAVDVDVLFKQIQEQKETIEGVTFLGGEPFEQAEALSYIAQKVQCMGLSVLTFTGYKYETLLGLNNKHVNKLLANTDLLIDGEFQEQNLDYSRPWVGSSNQRYLLLTKNTAGVILGYKKSV